MQISSGTVRRGEVNNKGYKIAQFTDAWARYLPASASVTPSQPLHSAAFTANSSDEDRDACKRHGMDGFLTKPLRPQELTAAIERHLDRKRKLIPIPVAQVS